MSMKNSIRLFKKYLKETPREEILKLFDEVEKRAPHCGTLEEYFEEVQRQLEIK